MPATCQQLAAADLAGALEPTESRVVKLPIYERLVYREGIVVEVVERALLRADPLL